MVKVLESTVDLFTPLQEGLPLPDVAMQDGDVMIIDRLDPGELDEYDRALVARTTLARPVIAVRVLNYGAGGGLSTINLAQWQSLYRRDRHRSRQLRNHQSGPDCAWCALMRKLDKRSPPCWMVELPFAVTRLKIPSYSIMT
jgi:hypothetical protein